MSLIGKKWQFKSRTEGLPLLEQLLKNRKIDDEDARRVFLEGGLEELHDPFLLKDMQKAVDRIEKAIGSGEKIMIFGDYDVDGITGTAILYDYLKMRGADVGYTLPHREDDGYGLKDYFIKKFAESGVNLIVTVDCGTANWKEVEMASEMGIDTVITDHHTMPAKLPEAVAIVNPHQPDCEYPNLEISGAGIAYKLISALSDDEEYLRKQLGIAALGLVGDCMSMLSPENRAIVKEGVAGLTAGDHPGIVRLLEASGAKLGKITSGTIGFQIGPRINAAGRLDKPDHSLELLLGNLDKAELLNKLNLQRQGLIQAYMKGVHAYLSGRELPNIIVILSKEWRSGLLGLIASKVVDQYERPAIVMQDKGDELVASMRSMGTFDITGAVRTSAAELFSAFGGHAMAGGFTLPKENLEEFLKRVHEAGQAHLKEEDLRAPLEIDFEVNKEQICEETCDVFTKLEPFGPKNPEPTVVVKNAQIKFIRPVGKQKEHLQFPIEVGGKTFKAIAFRFGKHLGKIDPTQSYDIAFNMEMNEWNGKRNVQLRVVDLKPSDD